MALGPWRWTLSLGAACCAASTAAARTDATPYPTKEILTAFGDICFDAASKPYYPANANIWKKAALEKGWIELASAPVAGEVGVVPPGGSGTYRDNADYRTYYWFKALNYDLFSSLLRLGTERMQEDSLLKKSVGGRDVYLSILGVDAGPTVLTECRLFDPLGDGFAKQPVVKADIENWVGRSVVTSRGSYRGTKYSWLDASRVNRSVSLHFGFAHKPLAKLGAKYDPYALYGMSLVRSDHSSEIVT